MYSTFYTVVILKLDIFESTIVDERHFATQADATDYALTMRDAGYIPVIAKL